MHLKPFQLLLASSLILASTYGQEDAVQSVAAENAETAEVAPAVPVDMSEDELIELVGYLTAQGGGVSLLQLEKASVLELADGLLKGLSGELDLMEIPQAEVEAAFGAAQARAEAVQAGSQDLPAISAGALEKIGLVIAMQSGLQQLGFGEEEAELIREGFVTGSLDQTPDPELESKIPALQAFMQPRIEAAQAEMMKAQAAAQAEMMEAQAEAMREFDAVAEEWKSKDNFNVVLETTQGEIEIELFPSVAPIAVANFVGHIENDYYDGLTFHRVIDGFMIQGGDPLGTGTGGESIWEKNFPDEFSEDARFDEVGILAMANSGPMTNGSQFFITTSTPEWLNDKHTILGKVVAGYDNVKKIEAVETGAQDKPLVAQKILDAYVKK